MNSLKKVFLLLFSLVLFSYPLSSQNSDPQGIALCDSIYAFFNDLNFDIEKQDIISPVDNTFPYNIILHFDKQNPYDDKNLIICIKMESAYKNQDLVFDLIKDLLYRDFNSTLLFIYGTETDSAGLNVITGSESFLTKLNPAFNYSAFILNLTSNKNMILTGSEGQTSPSWLVNATYNAYIDEHLSQDLPIYYLSQLAKLKFNKNPLFAAFAEENIPVISAGFNLETTNKRIVYNVISNFLDSYSSEQDFECDYHSLMLRIGNRKFWLSEYTIIKILLIVTFLSLLLVFVLAYLSSSIKSAVWTEIRKNWYTLPVTFLLTIAGCFIAKLIYIASTKNGTKAITDFGLPVLEIILSSVLISTFYLIEILLHKKSYGERSIDFLVLITTFINEVIFILSDISLFPLFLFICLCSILSLIIHKNWFHVLIFLIFIVIYYPYVNLLHIACDSASLKNFLISSNMTIFALALCVLPIYMMWLRILTAIQNSISKRRVYVITIIAGFILSSATLILFNNLLYKNTNISYEEPIVEEIDDLEGSLINISYSDKKIFENTYRTVNIALSEDVTCMELNLKGAKITPVLYSDNDYEQLSSDTVSFGIPVYPPKNLTFSFGTSDPKTTIEVRALINKDGSQKIYSKSIIAVIGDK